MKSENQVRHRIFIAIGILVIFSIGYVAGMTMSMKEFVTDSDSGEVEISKVVNLYSKTRSSEVEFDQFWKVWDKIKDQHVAQPVNDVDLFYGAISGLVKGLDDPYSIFFPPREAKDFADDLSGEFEGIGAEIGIRDDQLIIISPLPKSPAEKSGLEPGDKIFAVDGEQTHDMTLDEAVSKIRGKKDTEVILTISQDGYTTVKDVIIVRGTINIPTVLWEDKGDGIKYLRVSYFNETTWSEFDKAVKEILESSPKGIVLDMRRNPGGFLETSIIVASEWIDSGVVVKEKYSDGKEKEYRTRGTHRLSGIPTVVLVDEGTASGAEIVAGALQDYSIAKLVGIKTFGKGSVQDFDVFEDGSALKLTIAKWFTPNDRQIDGEGIMPDVIVEEMFSQNGEGENAIFEDKGIEKAIELLKLEIGK
ncbi:MAG: S41 family peptidase [Candidatus Magasanikbacteria bacterium]